MNKLTLIVGRSGSGKDTLVNAFEKLGYTSIKSYTTRPCRGVDDNGHIFISPEDIDKYPNKIATATINDYFYFATREQVNKNDIYVINPNAIEELIKNLYNTDNLLLVPKINLIYIMAKNNDKRCKMAIARSNDPVKEADIFTKRDYDENDQFTAFENRIHSGQKINGIDKEIIFLNDYNKLSIDSFAKWCVGRII